MTSPNIRALRCLTCKHAVASNRTLPVRWVEAFIEAHAGHDVRCRHAWRPNGMEMWFDASGRAIAAPPGKPDPLLVVARKALQKETS